MEVAKLRQRIRACKGEVAQAKTQARVWDVGLKCEIAMQIRTITQIVHSRCAYG